MIELSLANGWVAPTTKRIPESGIAAARFGPKQLYDDFAHQGDQTGVEISYLRTVPPRLSQHLKQALQSVSRCPAVELRLVGAPRSIGIVRQLERGRSDDSYGLGVTAFPHHPIRVRAITRRSSSEVVWNSLQARSRMSGKIAAQTDAIRAPGTSVGIGKRKGPAPKVKQALSDERRDLSEQ